MPDQSSSVARSGTPVVEPLMNERDMVYAASNRTISVELEPLADNDMRRVVGGYLSLSSIKYCAQRRVSAPPGITACWSVLFTERRHVRKDET